MRFFLKNILLVVGLSVAVPCVLSALSVGSLNIRRCLEESKPGKKEQEQFEQLRKQLEQGVEAKEKELNELKPKLEGEYLDTLTPEAEQQVKEQFQKLQQEHQELYYNMSMMLNKAQYEMVQKMLKLMQAATEEVAKSKKQDDFIVINDEALFYRPDAIDITDDVIQRINETSESEKK